jgi:hypothetical protein
MDKSQATVPSLRILPDVAWVKDLSINHGTVKEKA